MNDIETLIALVAAAIVLVRLADAISIPYPIVLVLGGLGIGFIPGGPNLELEPDVVFLVFLPPILQSAGYWSSLRELRAQLIPLTWLVLGLTLVTMVAVAVVAQTVIPSINWAEAFVLGAIVAPTDPVSAIATFQRLGISDRVATLVEGESMINDAVALVSYKVALAALVSGAFTAETVVDDLIVSVAGGVAIGLATAWVAALGIRRLDDPPLAILLTVLLGVRLIRVWPTGSGPRAYSPPSRPGCTPARNHMWSSTPTPASTPRPSGGFSSLLSTQSSSSWSASSSRMSFAEWASSSRSGRSSATGC